MGKKTIFEMSLLKWFLKIIWYFQWEILIIFFLIQRSSGCHILPVVAALYFTGTFRDFQDREVFKMTEHVPGDTEERMGQGVQC